MPFLRQLHLAVEKYYHLGALSSTYKVYRVGLSRYQSFCTMAQKPPVPASEDTLLLITVHLAMEVISSNIKVYLLAIRSSHVRSGRHDDLARQLTPRLQQAIKGIQKTQVIARPPRVHLPIITLDIMQGIHSVLAQQPQNYYNMMIWAACIFGFLRSSEFTVPSQSQLILTLMYISACQISPWTAVTPLKWSKSTLNNLKPILFDGE